MPDPTKGVTYDVQLSPSPMAEASGWFLSPASRAQALAGNAGAMPVLRGRSLGVVAAENQGQL